MRSFKKGLALLLVLLMVATLFAACSGSKETNNNSSNSSKASEVIIIKAQTKGGELTRVTNLEAAAEKLNEELKAEGKNITVKVEGTSFDGGWEDYRKQFILAFQSGDEPDIFVAQHEELPWLAAGGYIIELDDVRKSEAYADVYQSLWPSVEWKGKTWGVPQDTEVRPIFYNKVALKKLGWTDEEIESLPEKAKNGEFTIRDMTKVAKEAKDKGIVQWGITHRPSNGIDFHMIAMNFGADLYDEANDKLIFDKKPILETLKYFHDLTQVSKVTPEGMTQMEWKNIHKLNSQGEGLFWYGGIWNVFNWIKEAGANYDDILENFGFMLVPPVERGGKGMTLSHPLVYTISSKSEHPEIAKRLLELVTDAELQVKHAVETTHLPINKSGANHEKFKKDRFLPTVTYMLDYTTFAPNNENFTLYGSAFYKAIQEVEIGEKTPEEALDFMEKQLKNDLGDNIIIK